MNAIQLNTILLVDAHIRLFTFLVILVFFIFLFNFLIKKND